MLGIIHLPKDAGNFGGKCLAVKNVFHLTHVQSIRAPFSVRCIPHQKYKMAAQLLWLNKIVELSLEEESLVAVAAYMMRDLHRNQSFYENILPRYTIDEFKSHSRMT